MPDDYLVWWRDTSAGWVYKQTTAESPELAARYAVTGGMERRDDSREVSVARMVLEGHEAEPVDPGDRDGCPVCEDPEGIYATRTTCPNCGAGLGERT